MTKEQLEMRLAIATAALIHIKNTAAPGYSDAKHVEIWQTADAAINEIAQLELDLKTANSSEVPMTDDRARPPRLVWWCPDCRATGAADEDGCCTTCGADSDPRLTSRVSPHTYIK